MTMSNYELSSMESGNGWVWAEPTRREAPFDDAQTKDWCEYNPDPYNFPERSTTTAVGTCRLESSADKTSGHLSAEVASMPPEPLPAAENDYLGKDSVFADGAHYGRYQAYAISFVTLPLRLPEGQPDTRMISVSAILDLERAQLGSIKDCKRCAVLAYVWLDPDPSMTGAQRFGPLMKYPKNEYCWECRSVHVLENATRRADPQTITFDSVVLQPPKLGLKEHVVEVGVIAVAWASNPVKEARVSVEATVRAVSGQALLES